MLQKDDLFFYTLKALLKQLPTQKGLLSFSRSDGQNSGPTLCRIYCIYVGEALEAKGGWCRITPGTTFSDHYPVITHIQ